MSSELDPVEALLEEARLAAQMPSPAERLRLRTAAGLSRQQVATAVGVGRQTVANWESGVSDPTPPARLTYLRILDGLAALHPAPAAVDDSSAADPADEIPAALAVTPPPAPGPAPVESAAAAQARTTAYREQAARRDRSAARTHSDTTAMITRAVQHELDRAEGDADAATAALIKRAIPDVMALWKETRTGARYEHTSFPALPDILHKPRQSDPDLVWEARPSWRHPGYRRTPDHTGLHVTPLDTNAAYLSALKVWLPIGKLEHSTGGGHDRKRAGIHLVTPAPWTHSHLPNPIGDREEPGPVWITESTLRLLLRLAGPKHRLADPPVIHESWTAGATENFCDDLRVLLATARQEAIDADDDVTLAYIKAMYSKFVSTLGESVHNREIVRPDWMHIVRAQAGANLWGRAYKAHQAGLTLISVMGTDELHLTGGDWRQVFSEGRALTDLKVKTDSKTGAAMDYRVDPVEGSG